MGLVRLQVRPAAQILEVVVPIEADGLAVEPLGELELVRLVLRPEAREQLVSLHAVLPHERDIAREDAAHLLLDPFEIVGRDRLGELEVVVEAVGDGGPDRDLGVGPQVQHRLRHHVRGRMPEHRQRGLVAVGQDADRLAVVHRQAEVAHLAVDLHRDCRIGQPRADRSRRIAPRRALVEGQLVAVREQDAHAPQHTNRAARYARRDGASGGSARDRPGGGGRRHAPP